MAEGETSQVKEKSEDKNETAEAECTSDWFGGWLKSAKSKSLEVFDFMQKDIDEFTSTIRQEAGNVVSSTATSLRDKLKLEDPTSTAGTMKKSMSDFFGHVANVFTPETEDDGDTEAYVIRNNEPVIMDRLQTQLLALRQDPNTFTEESPDPEWLATFDMESKQSVLSDLMVTHADLRSNYTRLVPSKVSHLEFWHRYFYKVHMLEEEEKQRQALKQRAEQTDDTEDLDWGEDEFAGKDVDIPKDVQDKLLDDYEKEITKTDNGQKSCDKENSLTDSKSDRVKKDTKELRSHERGDMVVVDESSSRTTPSSGEKESLDDDWEKELEVEGGLEETGKQYIMRLRSQFLAMTTLKQMDWSFLSLYDISVAREVQKNIVSLTLRHPLCRDHGPSSDYQRAFIKQLKKHVSQCGWPVEEELDICYAELCGKGSQEPCYKTLLLTDSLWVKIQEQPKVMVSQGSTGHRTWFAAICLAEWARQHARLFAGKTVLELGCGTGLAGIVICQACCPSKVIFSDNCYEVLEKLPANLSLNFADVKNEGNGFKITPSTNVEIQPIDWELTEETVLKKLCSDVVVCADVVYDCSVIPHLVRTVDCLLERRGSLCIVCSTVRNEETLRKFRQQLDAARLTYDCFRVDSFKFLSDENCSVEMCLIRKSVCHLDL